MDVNDLQELIGSLRRKMRTSMDEAETRRKLIDPLLQGMGWNIKDPNQVKQEYSLGPGRVDYALFEDASKNPSVVVEAKKLSISRRELDKAADQGIGYCMKDGIPYFAVTDGRIWEVYETHKVAPLLEKLVVSFDLASPLGEAAGKCASARELWRRPVGPPPPEPPPPPPPPGKVFEHGLRVGDDGYVLTKRGKPDKRYSDLCPPGTKWVVDGFPLDEEGWVLTPKGNPATRFKIPCPTNTKRIIDWKSKRLFLDADGYVLTKSGKPDKRHPDPYPPGAVEFVYGFPLDAEGWVLTKRGERDKRYSEPYY